MSKINYVMVQSENFRSCLYQNAKKTKLQNLISSKKLNRHLINIQSYSVAYASIIITKVLVNRIICPSIYSFIMLFEARNMWPPGTFLMENNYFLIPVHKFESHVNQNAVSKWYSKGYMYLVIQSVKAQAYLCGSSNPLEMNDLML